MLIIVKCLVLSVLLLGLAAGQNEGTAPSLPNGAKGIWTSPDHVLHLEGSWCENSIRVGSTTKSVKELFPEECANVGEAPHRLPYVTPVKRKVRIEWRDANGNRGHGETCFTEREAAGILVGLARDYPDMQHWVSTCKP